MRLVVNKAFTPKLVAKIEDYVHTVARDCVAGIAEQGTCDFVTEVAAPMPLRIICDMMGVPEADRGYISEQSNHLTGDLDPEYNTSAFDIVSAGFKLADYGKQLAADRVKQPGDDLTTALVQAEYDGHRLTDEEIGGFFALLCAAGNETTRNAISHGLLELSRRPDQKALLLSDPERYLPTAVEEIVRYASPVTHMRRTVTEQVELPSGRHTFEPGDKVVLWYRSANHDEDAFDRPEEFDITRSPNEHVGFGAGGPHFCLGAHLARREIRVLFEELFRMLPDIHASGEPAMLRSSFLHGIKHLEAEFTPTSP